MPTFLTNRIALTQWIALSFAGLAACHIVLPPSVSVSTVVAAILLVSSALSAILRFAHPGDPGADAKTWWQSRTLWTQIVGAGFALAALAGIVPAIDQPNVVETVMTLVGIVSILLGRGTTRPIARTRATLACPALVTAGALAVTLLLGGCSIAGVRSGSTIAATISEAAVAAELDLVKTRIDTGTIVPGETALKALRRINVTYAALAIGRAAFDTAENSVGEATPAEVLAARRVTDDAYMAIRVRLIELAGG